LKAALFNYAKQVKEQGLQNKFHGKNFVFDNRLGERITDEIIATCHQCGQPADTHVNCRNEGCHLLFIQCEDVLKRTKAAAALRASTYCSCRKRNKKRRRKGIVKGQNVFNKSRKRLRPKLSEQQ
jgi:UPF0176 protein